MPRQFAPVAEADWSIDQPIVGRAVPCRDGTILAFSCRGVELLSFLPIKALGNTSLGAVWGWTDSLTGREFAIVARGGTSDRGLIFIEVTDPLNPRYLGDLAGYGQEINVYNNHVLSLARAPSELGLGIFDLAQLRAVDSAPVTFQVTARYREPHRIHTVAVNQATGFAYLNWGSKGGETCGGGLHMVDIHDPATPTFAGCYNDSRTRAMAGRRYPGIHDTQCVVYHGPDQRYQGRELCFNAAVAALSIADVTDKRKPKTISIATYPNVNFTHQGWLSDDQRYFFLADEFDEGRLAKQNQWQESRSRIIVFDVADLHDPVVLTEFFGAPKTVDHNLYARGRYLYQSDYSGGLRIIDVRDPENLKEVGYFYHPPESTSWNNYPYFTRNVGVIVFALYNEGLVLIRHKTTQ